MGWRAVLLVSLLALTGCQKESASEKAIKQKLVLMSLAEEKQDPQELSSLFDKDATFINLSANDTREGREAILAYFKQHLHPGLRPQVTITTESIKFIGDDIAIARGTMALTFPSGLKEAVAFKGQFQKVNDLWQLQKWTEITLAQTPSQYEHLKGLEWFVGKWTNADDDSTFTSKNRWGKNRNFLIQSFSLAVLGQKQLSGKQIIGWDQREGKIRSWIFDSEGGFGVGSWLQDQESWYVTVCYTMPDGSLASATHIYTKVDDASYTFSSISRDMNGDLQPNIGPFTIIKTK